MTSRVSERMVLQQDLYELFHDYWNLFTAVATYVQVLERSHNLADVEREAAVEAARLMPRLEEKMEAIRARCLSLTR